jgi:hypothetical protein
MYYWTIENPNPKKHGEDLEGLQIQQVSTGDSATSYYQLVKVLSTTNQTGSVIEFTNVGHKDKTWNIAVNSLVPGEKPLVPGISNSNGNWSIDKHRAYINPADTDPNDGSFTAQAGSTLAEESGEAASSAKA